MSFGAPTGGAMPIVQIRPPHSNSPQAFKVGVAGTFRTGQTQCTASVPDLWHLTLTSNLQCTLCFSPRGACQSFAFCGSRSKCHVCCVHEVLDFFYSEQFGDLFCLTMIFFFALKLLLLLVFLLLDNFCPSAFALTHGCLLF